MLQIKFASRPVELVITVFTYVSKLCRFKIASVLKFDVLYVGKSISKLQIQVATYVFELSAGNCHR